MVASWGELPKPPGKGGDDVPEVDKWPDPEEEEAEEEEDDHDLGTDSDMFSYHSDDEAYDEEFAGGEVSVKKTRPKWRDTRSQGQSAQHATWLNALPPERRERWHG